MDLIGKKVLVTGACGFIGSHLVEALVKKGAKVRAFVYYNSFGHWGWLDTLPLKIQKAMEVFSGDIRDFGSVNRAMAGMDVVFHLAALIGIPYSYVAPESYVDTNVKGTLNVLNAARENKVRKLVHTSTSEVYGTARYVPIDEKHPLQGQSPYAATKIAADMLAESFFRSFGIPVSICRPFNTFGPRQSARAVIPTILTQVLQGKKEIDLGNTETTRDFNYVTDTVEGFIRIGECDQTVGEVINIGSGREISIGDLVATLAKVLGRRIEIHKDRKRIRPSNSEVYRLCADSGKARAILGWEPKVALEEGLSRTAAWWAKFSKRYRPDLYII